MDEAADAARETLDLPSADARHLAAAADRLTDLATRLADVQGVLKASRRAWRTEPTRPRLLALATSGQAAGVLTKTLDAEADRVTGTDRLSSELLLLAGRLNRAIAA